MKVQIIIMVLLRSSDLFLAAVKGGKRWYHNYTNRWKKEKWALQALMSELNREGSFKMVWHEQQLSDV